MSRQGNLHFPIFIIFQQSRYLTGENAGFDELHIHCHCTPLAHTRQEEEIVLSSSPVHPVLIDFVPEYAQLCMLLGWHKSLILIICWASSKDNWMDFMNFLADYRHIYLWQGRVIVAFSFFEKRQKFHEVFTQWFGILDIHRDERNLNNLYSIFSCVKAKGFPAAI